MRKAFLGLAVLTAPILWSNPATAHHAYGLFFDLCKSVMLEGEIQSVQWKNPHIWIELKADDGTAVSVEWTSLDGLTNFGVAAAAREAVKPGDRIVVTGSPPLRNMNRNVISALTRIRRVGDSWSWERNPGQQPPGCAR